MAFTSKTLTDIETHCVNIEQVSVSVLQSSEIPYLYLWQACHGAEWPQAKGNDPAKDHPCGST